LQKRERERKMATTSGRGGGLTGPPKPPPHAAIQDGPPPGGYPPVDVRRNLPKVGPSGTTLLIGIGLITIYGFWGATKSAQRRRRLNQEKYQIRLAITPYLQAEQDRLEVKEVSKVWVRRARTAYEKYFGYRRIVVFVKKQNL